MKYKFFNTPKINHQIKFYATSTCQEEHKTNLSVYDRLNINKNSNIVELDKSIKENEPHDELIETDPLAVLPNPLKPKQGHRSFDIAGNNFAQQGYYELDENYLGLPCRPSRANHTNNSQVYLRRFNVHRLILRGVPKKVIAEKLKISIETVYSDIKHINRSFRREIKSVELPVFMSLTISFFNEHRDNMSSIAFNKNNTVSERIKASSKAIEIEIKKQEFLRSYGLYAHNCSFFGVQNKLDVDLLLEKLAKIIGN